jgi:SAM-dependent methyltransferase
LPFDDGSFDIAWTQHVAMNIADRSKFYSEAHRVLRPGGSLAIYDVLAGGGGPLVYPVPWSKTEDSSFLLAPEEMKAQLSTAGFDIQSWVDRTDAALAWFAGLRKQEASAAGSGPVGLHLAMGPNFKVMTGNLARNLDEGRAVLIEAVVVKTRRA